MSAFGKYTGLELKRVFTDRRVLILSIAVPVFMYLVIGGTNDDTTMDSHVGHANVRFLIAVSMAMYGTVTVAGTECAKIATERGAGWMRTLALTRLSPKQYLASKAITAIVLSLVPVSYTHLTLPTILLV